MALKYNWDFTGQPNWYGPQLAAGRVVSSIRAQIPALADAPVDLLYDAAMAEMLAGGISFPANITLPGQSRTVPTVDTYLDHNKTVNVRDWSATGDGTTDDRPFIANADTDTAASKSALRFPPTDAGTPYLIGSNLTISRDLVMEPGAVLKPASGVTIAILGAITAPSTQIFDFSAGGHVSFEGNGKLTQLDAKWFGIVADGITADDAPLANMWASLPNMMRVKFGGQLRMLLTNTFVMSSRTGVFLEAQGDPRQGENNGMTARFKWGGAAGGTMIRMDSSTYCHLVGFDLSDSSNADIVVDIDYSFFNGSIYTSLAGGYIGSSCRVERCFFENLGNRTGYRGVRISHLAQQNQEYHEVVDCKMVGVGTNWNKTGIVTTVGSPNITAPGGTFDTVNMVGARIRILGAGASGAVLDTTIVSMSDNAHAVLAANASTAVTARASISSGHGAGIEIGPSSNAHRQRFIHNDIAGFAYGIHAQSGSFLAYDNQLFTNQVNYYIEALSQPSLAVGDNSETSWQHIWMTSGVSAPFSCDGGRLDIENTSVGDAFIRNDSGAYLSMRNSKSENALPDTFANAGCTLFSIAQTARLKVSGWSCGATIPLNQLGVEPTLQSFEHTDLPVNAFGTMTEFFGAFNRQRTDAWWDGQATLFGGNYTFASMAGINEAQAIGGTRYPLATSMSPFNADSPKPANVWLVAHVATMGSDTEMASNNSRVILYHGRMPIQTFAPAAANITEIAAFFCSAPSRVGGTTNLARAFHSEPLKTAGSGVAKAIALEMEGASDLNYLRGPTAIGVPNAVPADADIDSNSLARFYNDDTNGRVKLRVKDAAGVFHTAEIPYDGGTVAISTGASPDFAVARAFSLAFAANATVGVVLHPQDGQSLILSLQNTDTASHTVALNACFNAPSLNSLTVPATSTRTLHFVYDAARSLWLCAGDVTV